MYTPEEEKIIKQAEEIVSQKWLELSDTGLRMSGRTTRIIDDAIQKLFRYGEVLVSDHHRNSYIKDLDYIKKRMMDRLAMEHRNIFQYITCKTIPENKFELGRNTNFKLEIKIEPEAFEKLKIKIHELPT